jgi:hypothetical protein
MTLEQQVRARSTKTLVSSATGKLIRSSGTTGPG